MKSLTKRIATFGFVVLYVMLSVFVCMYFFQPTQATADTKTIPSSTYFYDNLTIKDEDGNAQEYTLAKKFYNAIDEINRSGDFKDGIVEYSLNEHNILTSDQVQNYTINGDISIPKAFSAARDAYLTDHPELFYIDFYKMTISVSRVNGVYTAYIDSGREANLYYDNGFSSLSEVESAIVEFNNKIDEIIAYAKDEAKNPTYGTAEEVVLARAVNHYLANRENVTYDYGALDDYIATGSTANSASSVYTAYGSLVVGKAVCSGFARGYKAVLDKLGIPCIVVSGYSVARDTKGDVATKGEPHAWNYVWYENSEISEDNQAETVALADEEVEGQWYVADITWNNTGKDKNKYFNMGDAASKEGHITDGVISSSGYELQYPEVAMFNYGCTTTSNGLIFGIEYIVDNNEIDEYGNPIPTTMETVSYNGMSAKTLYDKYGLHLAVRYGYFKEGETTLSWTSWMDLSILIDKEIFSAVIDDGTQVAMPGNASNLYVQYAVFDSEPELDYNPDYTVDGNHIPVGFNLYYDYENEPGDHMSAITEVLENKCFGTYTPAPYAVTCSPITQTCVPINDSMRAPNSNLMDPKNAFTIQITYGEDLHILDPNQKIGISFIAKHHNVYEYAKLLPLDDSDTYCELLSDKRTLKFKFMPSLMYEHNGERYTFSFTNIGSAAEKQRPVRDEKGNFIYDKDGNVITETYTSDKLPNSVGYSFARLAIDCPARFNYDGRLWIECCAQPTLLDNSNLADINFEDPDGNTLFSPQERSQMLLVVDSVKKDDENTMLNEINDNQDINVKKEDIKASATYDISLQICNKHPKIPDGSFVKIALGFPEGFGPKNEGVTFKIYHRKHIKGDEYIVEEIPCVVTQFGIVATVTSFSPYMVAVVDADKASSDKTIYANIEGKGGKLNKDDGKIQSLKKGESYTYSIVPDDGYIIYSVMLNHKEVKDKVTENGKLTLSYDELNANNELEIKYIAIEAAKRFIEKDIMESVTVIVDTKGVTNAIEGTGGIKELVIPEEPILTPETPKTVNTGVIIGSVVAAAVVLAAIIIVSVIFARKKKWKI